MKKTKQISQPIYSSNTPSAIESLTTDPHSQAFMFIIIWHVCGVYMTSNRMGLVLTLQLTSKHHKRGEKEWGYLRNPTYLMYAIYQKDNKANTTECLYLSVWLVFLACHTYVCSTFNITGNKSIRTRKAYYLNNFPRQFAGAFVFTMTTGLIPWTLLNHL